MRIARDEGVISAARCVVRMWPVVALPARPFAVEILHPENPPATNLGVRHDDVHLPIPVDVADNGSRRVRLPTRFAAAFADRMLDPLRSVAVDVLEPDVRSRDIQMPIAVNVANGDAGMS